MIKFRFSAFEKHAKDRDLEITDGEKLSAAIERATAEIPLGKFEVHEVFVVSVNGKRIEHDFWPFTMVHSNDSIIVSPNLKSGEGGQVFRIILQIVVIVVASYFTAGLSNYVAAGIVAASSIVAGLLLNALIPPPVPDLGSLETINLGDSQMYAILHQSNATKRLGSVPQVYGTHRIFPNVAANPYTDLETDPQTGQLVQYLYAIYDFGFGPLVIDGIKIGDTDIGEFSDYAVNLIDLNKPAVSGGSWDDVLRTGFQFYRGDQEIESVASILFGNQDKGDVLNTYQTVRTSAANTDGVSQEISLQLVNPSGLFGYNASGSVGPRSIDMDIHFAPINTENWQGFNDPEYVNNFTSAGGDQAIYTTKMELFPSNPTGNGLYTVFPDYAFTRNPVAVRYTPGPSFPNPHPASYHPFQYYMRRVGLPVGTTQMVVKNLPASLSLSGATIGFQGSFFSRLSHTSVYGPNSAYTVLHFMKPSQVALTMFTYEGYKNVRQQYTNKPLPDSWVASDPAVLGKVSLDSASYAKARITRSETAAAYSTFKFAPKVRGQFKVRVTRLSTFGTFTSQTQDTLTWLTMSTRFDRAPILTDKRHIFLELKIRATNQLNGAIQNLSATCTSVLPVYNPATQLWVNEPTTNPAWVVAHLLTSQVNKRAVDKSRLHTDSFVEWAEFCAEVPPPPAGRDYRFPRARADFVLDYPATLQTVINQVTSASQASLNIVDGKYGILIDKLRTTPVQLFTPRNSRDFGSQRIYTARPHALKVKFVDPSADWNISEIIAYDNGYNETNATEFEEISTFACTNDEQAWRFGRYMIAQNRLRQETISLTVDFEHLVCTRGDFVKVTQDVMRVGGTPARVTAISGNRITIDDGIVSDPLIDYGYVFRSSLGVLETSTLTIVSATQFDVDGGVPAVGSLIVIGEVGLLTYDCIVKSIAPNDDMSASITLVEKADGVYAYESTETFPDYSPAISRTTDPTGVPPGEVLGLVVSDSGYECNGSQYRYFIEIDWSPPAGSAYETFQVFANFGSGFELAATTRQSIYNYTVAPVNLGREHSFKVFAVSATGLKLDLGAVVGVSTTPLSKTAPPSDVERFDIDITGEVLQLVWPRIGDCDVREYLIRYSPLNTGTWESSIPLLRIDRNATLAATQARTGTYLIKAVDFNGNESSAPAVAITTIPNLFNLNVIETLSDAPTWPGALDRTVVSGATLLLQTTISGDPDTTEYESEGFYYYESLLDLGEIYTVRLQSLLQAEGYTLGDFMSAWPNLSSVLSLSSARFSEWDVEAQYRSTETLNVIADWVTLGAVGAMASGVEENFTPWRKFIMGDATGRVFQFRLRLLSNKISVSPRVFDGTIKADMPDRIESFDNLSANNTTGYILAFNPSFKGPGTRPNTQISIDDAESGDYWSFDYKTLDGFQIKFYDKNDIQVARQFDVVCKGYGRKAVAVI